MHKDQKQPNRRLKSSHLFGDQAAPMLVLAALAVAALVALASQLAAAEPASSNGQQLAENSIGGQAYSNLASADGLDLGRRPFRNAKRARKMTFMPMRGRKDGRDGQLAEQQFEGALAAVEEQILAAANKAASQGPMDGDTSIMRLLSAQLAAGGSPSGYLGEPLWRGQPTPAPRQFLARHLQQHEQSQQPEVGGGESLFELGLPVQPAARMQAKLRRAFLPMRGKKSAAGLFGSEMADQDEPESDSD